MRQRYPGGTSPKALSPLDGEKARPAELDSLVARRAFPVRVPSVEPFWRIRHDRGGTATSGRDRSTRRALFLDPQRWLLGPGGARAAAPAKRAPTTRLHRLPTKVPLPARSRSPPRKRRRQRGSTRLSAAAGQACPTASCAQKPNNRRPATKESSAESPARMMRNPQHLTHLVKVK